MSNRDKLKQAMKDKNLNNRTVAARSGYSIHTINAYMLPDTSKAHRPVPDRALELILLKL